MNTPVVPPVQAPCAAPSHDWYFFPGEGHYENHLLPAFEKVGIKAHDSHFDSRSAATVPGTVRIMVPCIPPLAHGANHVPCSTSYLVIHTVQQQCESPSVDQS